MSEDTAGRVVRALSNAGLLAPGAEEPSRAVVARALGEKPATQRAPGTPRLVEVVAYLGAALVLAAGFLFVLRSWDDLGDVGQVSFLLAVALVLAIAGAAAAPRAGTREGDLRRRLSGTLLTGSALAAGTAAGVALAVFSDRRYDDVHWPSVVGGVVVVAGSALAYRVSSTTVGLVGMVGGLLDVGMGLGSGLAPSGDDEAVGVGIAVFSIGVVWVLLTELGVFDQLTIARTLGVTVATFGAQVMSFTDDRSWIGYLMSLVVVGVGVWLYLTRLDWPYLAAAVVAVTLVVPEAVSDWTDNSLGAVGGVLLAGVTLLAASFAAYRLRQETTD
jgi:hypothetical protein